jgi:crotonobetainyl-CoA:carnitine CoA-transferase CaiB-like acyl-CoA transferase
MKPLEGVNVLEFSTMITASFAAMMMAEQGASVIKVEPIELGDPMRFLGSSKGGISALFANCNRGKRSLRLNIKEAEGRQIIEAAITGFGTEGPDRDLPAYDPVIQCQTGFGAVQGHGRDEPELVRTLTCDKSTAYTACQAVTAALYAREKTGEGQHIDLSMMDAGLFFLFPDGFMHQTLLDDDADQKAPLHELLYDLTITKDGGVTVSAANEAQQVGMLTAIDQLHLFADERFNSVEKLIENIEEFRDLLKEEFLNFETDDLLQRLGDHDVPAAKCLTYDEVLEHRQYEANASMDTFEHPIMGTMRRMKLPARFHGQRLEPGSASPAHGEHTLEVLKELGRSEAEIQALLDKDIAR